MLEVEESRKVNVALSQRRHVQHSNLLWNKLTAKGRAGERLSPGL